MKAKPGKTAKTTQPAGKTKPAAEKVAGKTYAGKSPPPRTAVTAVAKPATKPVSKPLPKTSAKPESPKVKMTPDSSNNSSVPAKASRPAPVAAPAKTKPPASTPSVAAPAKPMAQVIAAVATPAPGAALTQRPGRPSSRLASLTVPSMAQSVASTAAKASYMQLAAAPMIIPPLPSAAKKDPKLANNWKTKPVEQLTDAELLAMPDSEYMNDKQMAAFRLKLMVLKQDILNSAGETTEHLREDTVVVPDPADRATIEEEHALELRTRDRERKLLKKIEQSIVRIDAGDYGYCDETGESIGVGRLLARPTATLSLEAQQRRELKQKMFGD